MAGRKGNLRLLVPNADFAQFAAIRTLLGIVHAIAKCGVGQTNLFLDIGDHGG